MDYLKFAALVGVSAIALKEAYDLWRNNNPESTLPFGEYEAQLLASLGNNPENRLTVDPSGNLVPFSNESDGVSRQDLMQLKHYSLITYSNYLENNLMGNYSKTSAQKHHGIDRSRFGQRQPNFQELGYGMGINQQDILNQRHIEEVRFMQAAYGPGHIIRNSEDGYSRASLVLNARDIDEGLARLVMEAAVHMGHDPNGSWAQETYNSWLFGEFGIESILVGPEWWKIDKPYRTCLAYTEGNSSRSAQKEIPQYTLVDVIEKLNNNEEEEKKVNGQWEIDERNKLEMWIVVDPQNDRVWAEAFYLIDPLDPYQKDINPEGVRVAVGFNRPFSCGLAETQGVTTSSDDSHEEVENNIETQEFVPTPDLIIVPTDNNTDQPEVIDNPKDDIEDDQPKDEIIITQQPTPVSTQKGVNPHTTTVPDPRGETPNPATPNPTAIPDMPGMP